MATYNGEKYLKEQLDSILNQSYNNFELLIQDDCSTDSTVEILNSYKNKMNMKIFVNETNLGYIKNFEKITKKAEGDFIALCDQDDIWEEDKIELLLNNIGESSLIYSDSLLVNNSGNSLNIKFSHSLKNNFISTNNPLTFINDNCVSAHAMLFKKELLKYIFPFPKNVFFDAWIAANAASFNGIKYLDKCLVKYRQHDSNTLSKHNKKRRKNKTVTNKAQKKLLTIQSKIKVINTFLTMKTLSEENKKLLYALKSEYDKFEDTWFNSNLYSILLKNKDKLYQITTKNPKRLIFKESIGFKLYKALPIL